MVLEVALKKEEEEQTKLADLMAWQRHEEQVLAELVHSEQSARARLKDAQLTGQYLEIEELKRITYFLKKVAKDIEAQKQKLIEIAEAIEQQRMILLEAAKERKTLETLKEHKYEEWMEEVEAEERKFLDELATLKYAREGYGDNASSD
jgi:flagellar protein FliJ